MTPAYQQQLDVKIAQLTAGLEPFTQAPIEVFASPEQHYRMRAEFKIWQDYTHNCCQYAMFEAGSNRKSYTLETFPAASKGINQVMPELIAAINRSAACACMSTCKRGASWIVTPSNFKTKAPPQHWPKLGPKAKRFSNGNRP